MPMINLSAFFCLGNFINRFDKQIQFDLLKTGFYSFTLNFFTSYPVVMAENERAVFFSFFVTRSEILNDDSFHPLFTKVWLGIANS